jgi:hypothetical protein
MRSRNKGNGGIERRCHGVVRVVVGEECECLKSRRWRWGIAHGVMRKGMGATGSLEIGGKAGHEVWKGKGILEWFEPGLETVPADVEQKAEDSPKQPLRAVRHSHRHKPAHVPTCRGIRMV